jgi:hypothetical protein
VIVSHELPEAREVAPIDAVDEAEHQADGFGRHGPTLGSADSILDVGVRLVAPNRSGDPADHPFRLAAVELNRLLIFVAPER